MAKSFLTLPESLMNIDNDPPSNRSLLIYSSQIEDGKKMEEVFPNRDEKYRPPTASALQRKFLNEVIALC